MSQPVPSSIAVHFRQLPDPRVRRTRRRALEDILVITLCAVICGADDRPVPGTWVRARTRCGRLVAGRTRTARHREFGCRGTVMVARLSAAIERARAANGEMPRVAASWRCRMSGAFLGACMRDR